MAPWARRCTTSLAQPAREYAVDQLVDECGSPLAVPQASFFDLVIIGAGPAALTLVTRILETRPAAIYLEEERQHLSWLRRHRDNSACAPTLSTRRPGKGNERIVGKCGTKGCAQRSPMSILVVDKLGEGWMGQFFRNFASLEIPFLRSPMFFHPDPADLDGLLEYAVQQNRAGVAPHTIIVDAQMPKRGRRKADAAEKAELLEIPGVVGKEISKHKMKQRQNRKHAQLVSSLGPLINERDRRDYHCPSTPLFHDYCDELVKRYELEPRCNAQGKPYSLRDFLTMDRPDSSAHLVQGEIIDMDYGRLQVDADNVDAFLLRTSDEQLVGARYVVSAVGYGGRPSLPKWLHRGPLPKTYASEQRAQETKEMHENKLKANTYSKEMKTNRQPRDELRDIQCGDKMNTDMQHMGDVKTEMHLENQMEADPQTLLSRMSVMGLIEDHECSSNEADSFDDRSDKHSDTSHDTLDASDITSVTSVESEKSNHKPAPYSGNGWAHTMAICAPGFQFPPAPLTQRITSGEPLTAVIVGGGLSSAQICDMAVRRGFAKVVFVLRGFFKVKPFDFDIDWVGKYSNLSKMQFWQSDEAETRLDIINKARNGGSINVPYAKLLLRLAREGRLEIRTHTEVEEAKWDESAQKWTLILHRKDHIPTETQYMNNRQVPGTLASLTADYLVMSTGAEVCFHTLPFMRNLAGRLDVPEVHGLPVVDEDLQYGDVPLFCIGAYSAVQIGPTGFNLGGIREGADRIAMRLRELYDAKPRTEKAEPSFGQYVHFSYNQLAVDAEA